MDAGIAGGIGLKVAGAALSAAAKEGAKRLLQRAPGTKAVESTEKHFPALEGLALLLTAWGQTGAFASALDRLAAGEHDAEALIDDAAVASFVDLGFDVLEEREQRAREVLVAFMANLRTELLLSELGPLALANRAEVQHTELHTEVQQVGNTTHQLLDHVARISRRVELLADRAPLLEDERGVGAATDPKEQPIHARVDDARQLLDSGQARSAQRTLERIRAEVHDQPISPLLRFRIAANLAACALELGDVRTAQTESQAALYLRPSDVRALNSAAMVALVGESAEEALRLSRKAREIDPRNPTAAAIHVQALHRTGSSSADLEAFVDGEAWINDHSECCLVLGLAAYDSDDLPRAEEFFRRALELDGANRNARLQLGITLLLQAERRIVSDGPLPWRIPDELVERFREAEALLTEAADTFRDYENPERYHMALVNRASARARLGDRQAALEDCERVVLAAGAPDVLFRNKGLLLLHMGRAADAASCFERVKEPDQAREVQLPLADAYMRMGRVDRAIEIARPLFDAATEAGDAHRMVAVARLLIAAHVKAGRPAHAERLADELRERLPGDAEALAAVAELKLFRGNADEAWILAETALSLATGYDRDEITLLLADIHLERGEYATAAALYAGVVGTEVDNPWLRGYLAALFNGGNLAEALRIARTFRARHGPARKITEIEALVLEYVGDLPGAIERRLELAELEPKRFGHRVRACLNALRLSDVQRLGQLYDAIPPDQIEDGADLIQVAEIASILGKPDALELAYRARQRAFGDAGVHIAYARIFLLKEETRRRELEVSEAGVGTAVHLKGELGTRVFTILEEGPAALNRGELLPTDPLAVQLLGRHKGDRVVLREQRHAEVAYDVMDVQSKYVYAFQQTLTEFSTWFPNNTALRSVRFEGSDLAPLLTMVDEQHSWRTAVVNLYRQRRLTVGAVGRLAGRSTIDGWSLLVSRQDGRVIVSDGTQASAQAERELIVSAGAIVVDLTALLTITHLDLHDRLPKRFARILVPQPLLDEVIEELAQNQGWPVPSVVLGKEGNQYVRVDVGADALEASRQMLERMRDFIIASTEVVPVNGALELGRLRYDELSHTLGPSGVASILVAHEHGAPLYADDFVLRALASNDWGVGGLWSQNMLLELKRAELLSDEEYLDAVRRMALSQYHFVALDTESLLHVLRRSGMRVTDEVRRVFAHLRGPECDAAAAVRVTAELIRAVWLDALLAYQRLPILDLALEVLTSRRPTGDTLARLRARLQKRFVLLPVHFHEISRNIDLWTFQRGLQG